MSRIRILPENLSNKIAAGEVVERPASVVKELVENALDAHSDRITVEVKSGGRSLIRVADNGDGMNRDDALLSLERYATSKIFTDRDLFAINTLGFRGEALPSIASVSKFEMVTRQVEADTGTRIFVDGGKIKAVEEIGAAPGTMISVKQIFFNTPVRRKFLKTVATEMGHVADTLARIAMGRPDVRFKLLHNGKTVKAWSASSDPALRVADVLGTGITGDLLPVGKETPGAAVSGWVLSGRNNRSTSQGIYIYVNNRFVKDRVVRHAVIAGFSGRLMKGRFPVAALFVSVPPEEVDVNVHPTKHEVRFADQRGVHDAIENAVAKALKASDRSGWEYTPADAPSSGVDKSDASQSTRFNPSGGFVAERSSGFKRDHFNSLRPGSESTVGDKDKELLNIAAPESLPLNNFKPAESTGLSRLPDNQDPLWESHPFSELKIIGQFYDTYIVCESAHGLVLIDQHAAHERVAYEELKKAAAGKQAPAQRLLMPETLELSYRETDALEKLLTALAWVGFEIEPFGSNTYAISSVPALLARAEAGPLVREIVEKYVTVGIPDDPGKTLDPCIELMACHSVIRANQALTPDQIKVLLAQLDGCENPSHCPHGRPTWIKWSVKELEKLFKRS
ncbi:MAG: DNA mismatch repair endonuclease MutL [Desulfobacterales bacterium]|nr:DNA mismatch repair endonuclease MutL [Desulfobacterales bacterium]